MWVEQTPALRRAGEQDGSHRCRHTRHHHCDWRRDELHRVIYGHACGNGSAGRVEIERDLLPWANAFEIKELLGEIFCGFIRDGAPEENFTLIQEFLLDQHRYGRTAFF